MQRLFGFKSLEEMKKKFSLMSDFGGELCHKIYKDEFSKLMIFLEKQYESRPEFQSYMAEFCDMRLKTDILNDYQNNHLDEFGVLDYARMASEMITDTDDSWAQESIIKSFEEFVQKMKVQNEILDELKATNEERYIPIKKKGDVWVALEPNKIEKHVMDIRIGQVTKDMEQKHDLTYRQKRSLEMELKYRTQEQVLSTEQLTQLSEEILVELVEIKSIKKARIN